MRHLEQMPELALLEVEEKQLYSVLLFSDRAPHPLKETQFDGLYLLSCPVVPNLMTIGRLRNVYQVVN